jgi:1-aminocyclopropane-1-carboxylate deaminase/D-cysteine desulfhydrase-like pyridoxal-dependent ACC family enzyme
MEYLKSQFRTLAEADSSHQEWNEAMILDTSNSQGKPFVFGKPDWVLYETFQTLKKDIPEVEFDMVYAVKTWHTLFQHWHKISNDFSNLIYVHTGGTSGNVSQLRRYQRLKEKHPEVVL